MKEAKENVGTNIKISLQEMNDLSCNVRREVLNSTYPALYVVFFSILEGNTRENTWVDQQMKTLHVTKENHSSMLPFTKVR